MRGLRAIVPLCAMLAAGMAVRAPAQESGAVPCSWHLSLNGAQGLNVGWPDNNATYWYAHYVAIPGTRLVFRGIYPRARFFTIDVYDSKANPYVPGFWDSGLAADRGQRNPFTVKGAKRDARYTAFVEFAPRTHSPAANTIYAGSTVDGSALNAGGLITLRLYLPDDPKSLGGGVPLPEMGIEYAPGQRMWLKPCPVGGSVPVQPAVLQVIRSLGYPEGAPAAAPFPPAADPPVWTAQTNPNVDTTAPLPVKTGIGLLTTPYNSYLATRISREHGEIFVMRAKSPATPNTRAGQWVGTAAHLRYWSVCEFSTTTGQTAGCIADHEFHLDGSGYYTLVISTPAHRPKNARDWLPLGGSYEGWPTYRQFLPSSRFRQAIQNVDVRRDLRIQMGPFFPKSGYCSKANFERRGFACLRH